MIENSLIIFFLITLSGFFSGMINTVSGSGSIISLSVMIFLGIPVDIANGTNRVALLAQGGVNFVTFKKMKKMPLKRNIFLIIVLIFGSILGAIVASKTKTKNFEQAISVVMVLLLFIVFFGNWMKQSVLKKQNRKERHFFTKMGYYLLLIMVGFYGGFIQVGVGIMMILILSLTTRYDILEINGLKNFVVFIYMIPVSVIYFFYGKILWTFCIPLLIGQVSGAYFSGFFVRKIQKIELWIKILITFMIVFTLIKLQFFT